MGTTVERQGNDEAARKRAAVEIVARHGATLKRTARRYSLCAEDAEDAYQRALEILLRKAPTVDPRELVRWTQTVTKHEALAVRRDRERMLGRGPRRPPGGGEAIDWVGLLPAQEEGPDEAVERREEVARGREALRALKPAELRALSLRAEGYTYAEIGEITGFSPTKVNRSLVEGRERFRRLVSGSEDGSRCLELRPLLSAFCDGEASAEDATLLREHLRACGSCRAAMRAYRMAPETVAALAPALPLLRALLRRARRLLGGAKGSGMAKGLAVCATAAAGAGAVTGVLPGPFGGAEGGAAPAAREARAGAGGRTPLSALRERTVGTPRKHKRSGAWRKSPGDVAKPARREPGAASTDAQYAPPPAPAPVSEPPPPEPEPAPPPPAEAPPPSSPSASPAGEFGP